jgi:hypothetical protein
LGFADHPVEVSFAIADERTMRLGLVVILLLASLRPAAAAERPAAIPDSQTEIDVAFWKSVEGSKDRSELQAYLNRFPNGIFAELARLRLARLQPPSIEILPAPAPAPQPPAQKAPVATSPPPINPQPPQQLPPQQLQPPPARPAPVAPAPVTVVRPPAPPLSPASPGPQTAPPVQTGPLPSDPLGRRVAALMPQMAPQARDDFVKSYKASKEHKALAVVPGTTNWWSVFGIDSGTDVATKALEGCQIKNTSPCTLVMVDDNVLPAPATGPEITRDMARVRYRGFFDPLQIPLLAPNDLKRPEISGYKATTGPKAAALNVDGRFTAAKAPDQRAAEAAALAECNRDRRGDNGPCYLYAARDRVVLPLRLTAPRPPAANVADALLMFVANDGIAQGYRSDREHKALALELDGARTYRYSGAPDRAIAEQYVLEFCQIRWNTPCVLVASDDELKAPDPSAAPRRAAPRISYAGPYKPEMVPLLAKGAKELADYATTAGPKALAIGAAPPRARIGTGKTDQEAQAKALSTCNDPPDSPFPCILYAVNDRVILPQRRTEPSQ